MATSAERDLILQRLLRAPERGLRASELLPGRDPRAAGAVLRGLRESGYAERLGSGNTGRWRASPRLQGWRWAEAARAVAAPSPRLGLPAPPSSSDPARLEPLSFLGLRRLMEQFLGQLWFGRLSPSGPGGGGFFFHGVAEFMEIDRIRGADEFCVWFEDSSLLVFSRLGHRGAVMDRAFQEVTVRQGGWEASIEFDPLD